MTKLPECHRCQFYAHSPYLVCAVHPSGADSDRCLDFRPSSPLEREVWEVRSTLVYEQDHQPRLTRGEQWEILDTHPLFTNLCPSCGASFKPDISRVHWDCEACGWLDDSV